MARPIGQRRRLREKAQRELHLKRESWRKAYRAANPFEFPIDVIRNICRLAQKPLPPRATQERMVERGNYAQPVLAAMMRVSKAFYEVAGPILYTEIIADDILCLMYGAFASSLSHIPSKFTLLAGCRHLHLELLEPTFLHCSITRLHPGLPRRHLELAVDRMLAAQIQTIWTIVRLGGLRRIFPSVENFSMSAYTGKYSDNAKATGSPSAHLIYSLSVAFKRLHKTWAPPFRCADANVLSFWGVDGATSKRARGSRNVRRGSPLTVQNVNYKHIDHPRAIENIQCLFDPSLVWLYCPPLDMMRDGMRRLMDRLLMAIFEAIERIVDERYGLWSKNPKFVDIEIRIPRACISKDPFPDLLDRIDEDAEVARLMGRIWDYYDEMEDEEHVPRKDQWRIVFTDGPQYCPVCMTAVSPEAQAEEAGIEYVKGSEADWSLAYLWPEVEGFE